MRRRDFITLLGGAAAWPVVARAQSPNRIPQIGVLAFGPADSPNSAGFRQGMRDLGYIEGQNVRVEYIEYGARRERPSDLAAELVKQKVDVIFANGSEATRAAREASATIPIVMTSTNPLGLGFVASLARPGGNVTGLSLMAPEVSGKRQPLRRALSLPNQRLELLTFLAAQPHNILLYRNSARTQREYND
jgi:putative tryptophan/tyrosine transport system substrate-binding protein